MNIENLFLAQTEAIRFKKERPQICEISFAEGFNYAIKMMQSKAENLPISDVVGQSEQLCDYCKKPLENTCCNDCLEEMDNHNH